MSQDLPAMIRPQVDLKKLTSWKVGGAAQFFASPKNLEELKAAITWALTQNCAMTYLGQGSNVLVSDEGISGLVISTRRMQELKVLEEETSLRVYCQAGVLKYKLMRLFAKYNLSPALFLSGIPGDVGGGVVMNAGVGEKIAPSEFCEIIESVDVLKWSKDSKNAVKFEVQNFAKEDLQWSYRKSQGWQPGFVISAHIKWPHQPQKDLAETLKQTIEARRLKQPLDKPSCGSVFVNPEGQTSGALIETCGLKGFQIGGAQISNKHANFIVNTGSAKAQDIHQLIEHVKMKVFEKHKLKLHTEVVYLGQWST